MSVFCDIVFNVPSHQNPLLDKKGVAEYGTGNESDNC